MKTAIKYLSLIAVSLLVSCGNPAPTELYDDTTLQDNKGVKIGTPSTGGGYDSTGVSNQLIDKTTIISVSGIKNNNYGSYSPNESYYAQFNDKSKPIIIPIENKIGYRTKVMGNVFFKGIQAQIQPFILTYPINNLLKDTLVGSKYVLSSSMMIGHNNNNNSGFPYNSKVNFRLDIGKGVPIQFDIPTPPEITAKVTFSGSFSAQTIQMDLNWEAKNIGDIEVTIATFAEMGMGTQTIPRLKLVGSDNGKMKVPSNLLQSIPLDKNKSILVTVTRRMIKEIPFNETIGDNYIVAQSIYNIQVQIPN